MGAVKNGNINVRGIDFRWSVFRQPRWATGRTHGYTLLGLAILIEHPEPSHRDLLLEFGIDRSRHGDMPQHQRFRVPDGRLIEAIESAIESGYVRSHVGSGSFTKQVHCSHVDEVRTNESVQRS